MDKVMTKAIYNLNKDKTRVSKEKSINFLL